MYLCFGPIVSMVRSLQSKVFRTDMYQASGPRGWGCRWGRVAQTGRRAASLRVEACCEESGVKEASHTEEDETWSCDLNNTFT